MPDQFADLGGQQNQSIHVTAQGLRSTIYLVKLIFPQLTARKGTHVPQLRRRAISMCEWTRSAQPQSVDVTAQGLRYYLAVVKHHAATHSTETREMPDQFFLISAVSETTVNRRH